MVDWDNKPRGFGFVTFTDYEAVTAVLDCTRHIICDKQVECKLAVPKQQIE